MTPLDQVLYRLMLATWALTRLGRYDDALAVLEGLVLPLFAHRSRRTR